MLPGKKYKPEDLLAIAWKRRWLIVGPCLLVAGVTFLVAESLPDRYRAQTSVLVVPQRVPESFVRPTVTAQITERLQTISLRILSHTHLERIIEEFDLYSAQRKTMIMEDLVRQMRNDVVISTTAPRGRDGDSSFTISYESSSAQTALMVTERLASLFVTENFHDRELLADETNQFLAAQLEGARQRLIEHEKRLEQFRRDNAGRLPDQVQSNLQMMQNLQLQLQTLAESNNWDRDRLTILERTVAEVERTEAASDAAEANSSPTGVPVIEGGTAAQQLETARAGLQALERRLRPQHPDIGRAKRAIAELEAKAAVEAAHETPTAPAFRPTDATAAERVAQMRAEIAIIERRLEERKEEDARLRDTVAKYGVRVEAAPGLESQLTEFMRDYSTVQESYTTLLRKSQESQIAVNLERRQIGEQFRILDAPRLPQRPVSPDRLRINLFGLLGGLGLGVALVALLEYRNTTVATDDDVITSLTLPVLAVIPVMTTAAERQGIMRRRLVVGASASLAGTAIIAAILVWRLGLIATWVR